jgi:phage terminase large subunit
MKLTRVARMTIAAWKRHLRYISSCGGTRSSKTYSILQTFILAIVEEVNLGKPATINSVVSESMPHLQRGAIRDFKQIMETEGVWEESRWNETQHTYTWQNGSILEFFSVDNAGKVHGSARDRLFINESQNIPYEIARQLFVRTRGQIVCDYNPTHSFWLNEIVEAKQNCTTIHSTYKDNEFLTLEQIQEIEDNKSDANWWKVYGEGKVGTLEGLIYDFQLCDSLPIMRDENGNRVLLGGGIDDHLVEIQGLDFGFTNDPTARVQVIADHRKKILWVRQRCYKTHMQNKHIIQDLQEDGVDKRTEIYADCAEPKSIADIQDAGYNVIACDKDAPVKSDKLKFQLLWMQGWTLYVTKDSLELIRELRNYVWQKDKDGNPLNEPIDKFNHLLDALRYAVWTRFGQKSGYGEYAISFSKKRHGHN